MNTFKEFKQRLPPQPPPSKAGETYCAYEHAPSWSYTVNGVDDSGEPMHGCMRAHSKSDLIRMLKTRYPAKNIQFDSIQKVTKNPRTARSRCAS